MWQPVKNRVTASGVLKILLLLFFATTAFSGYYVFKYAPIVPFQPVCYEGRRLKGSEHRYDETQSLFEIEGELSEDFVQEVVNYVKHQRNEGWPLRIGLYKHRLYLTLQDWAHMKYNSYGNHRGDDEMWLRYVISEQAVLDLRNRRMAAGLPIEEDLAKDYPLITSYDHSKPQSEQVIEPPKGNDPDQCGLMEEFVLKDGRFVTGKYKMDMIYVPAGD